MCFNKCKQVKPKPTETIALVVEKDKCGGYSTPVVANDEETKTKLESIVEEHGTKNPLLNKGKPHIKVCFMVTGIYTKDDVNRLVFKVTKLSKIDKPELEDSCPED